MFKQAGSPRSTKDLMQCCTREQEQLAQYISAQSANADSSASALKYASYSHLGFALVLSIALSALL